MRNSRALLIQPLIHSDLEYNVDIYTAFQTFVRVAETESFSVTAREMNIGQPAVSKQISALEDHLGARLFQRTTRKLTLTDEGRALVPLARLALEAAEEALDSMRRREGRVVGTLRMTTAASFGRMHIVPRLPLFFRQFPEVRVDLVLQDTHADLIDQNIDLAIRFGASREENVISRRIGTAPFITVASRRYLERMGRPATPNELSGHDCLLYSGLAEPRLWTFERGEVAETVEVDGRLSVDNSDALRDAALRDLGIARVPAWLFADIWELEGMETLLDDWSSSSIPIHAVFPSRRFLPAKVRAMIDFLEHEIRLDPSMTGHSMPL